MVISRFRQYTQTTWKNVKQVILMQFDDDQLHTFAIIYVDAIQAHAYNMQCSILHIHIRSPTSHTRCGFVCTSLILCMGKRLCLYMQAMQLIHSYLSERIYKNMG